MAIQNAEAIQKLYVAYFNRPADYYGLQYWDSIVTAAKGDTTAVAAAFAGSAEYQATYAGMDLRNTINAIYKNLFGHSADIPGLDFWTNAVQTGKMTLSNAVTQIASGAQNADKTAYASKVAAATAFTNALDTTDEILGYSGDKANAEAKKFIAGVTDATTLATAVSQANLDATVNGVIGAGTTAQTFTLTKGLDVIPGTAGNDRIIASIDTGNAEVNTLSAVDSIDGGAGVDTLVIAAGTALTTASLANIKNVEIIEAQAASSITLDTTGVTGVTAVNVTRAGGAVSVTSSSTTDIGLNLKASAATTTLLGGKNVNVNLTDVTAGTGTVTVGSAGQAAAGTVVVTTAGAASVAAGDVTLAGVTITGGTSINVTEKATSSAAAAVADITGATITQGAVSITGTAATTSVSVKQDLSQAEFSAVTAVAAKNTTEEVVFTAAKAGDTVSVDFGTGVLSFTAKKDLTAAQVASAFANLTRGSTQGSASAELGIYANDAAGGVTDRFTSGAVETTSATTARVIFTSDVAASDLSASVVTVPGSTLTATAQNRVGGINGEAAEAGQLGIINGGVTIADAAGSIKNVTLDGYATSSITGGAVLDTLNLSNSGALYNAAGTATTSFGISVANTADTLSLNLSKVGARTTLLSNVTLSDAPTTLNVKSTGANFINLVADKTETLNVTGTGTLTANGSDLLALKTVKVSETAGLSLNAAVANTVESVDTTGTTGTVTITIQGDKATYTGGAGVDRVTVNNASTAISKAINLGAGNDTLTLSATLAIDPASTVELNGGDGIDTLVLSAAAAVARSAGVTFQDRITGFEKLSIGTVGVNSTVNLDNVDDINYVISQGASVGVAPAAPAVVVSQGANTVAPTAESASVTFGALLVGESITVAGRTVTATGAGLTAAEVAVAFATNTGTATAVMTGTLTDYSAAAGAGNAVTFTSTVAGDVPNLTPTAAGGAVAPTATITPSTAGTPATTESAAVTFGALAAGESFSVGGRTVTAVAALTSTQVATAFSNTGASIPGTVTVSGSVAGYTAGAAAGSSVTFTSTTAGAITPDLTASAAGNPGAYLLTLDKMLANATVEFAGAGNVEVKLADVSGTADVVNFVTAAAPGANIGTATADKVETINISVLDTDTGFSASGTPLISTNTLTVDADAAATINLSGVGNLTLNLSGDTKAVTLIDGSAATGILTITTLASDTAATTVKGGAAADVLTAMGANDVLQGGAGNDVLKVMGGVASAVTLTGGEGVDLFDVSGFRAANAGAAVSITDLAKGEKIKFVSNVNADFISSKVSLIAEATFDNYVTEAAKAADAATASHGIAWFQFNGNTFLVQDVDGNGAFDNTVDIIVKLTGIVDLSASSFNDVTQGTLQYI